MLGNDINVDELLILAKGHIFALVMMSSNQWYASDPKIKIKLHWHNVC